MAPKSLCDKPRGCVLPANTCATHARTLDTRKHAPHDTPPPSDMTTTRRKRGRMQFTRHSSDERQNAHVGGVLGYCSTLRVSGGSEGRLGCLRRGRAPPQRNRWGHLLYAGLKDTRERHRPSCAGTTISP